MYLALISLFVTGLGALTYACIPRSGYRGTSTALFLTLAVAAFGLSFESIGIPKPSILEWRAMKRLRVIGFLPNETDQKVYVWALRDGVPYAYWFPWPSDEEIQKLEDEWRKSRQTGEDMILSGDDDIANVLVEPALPPKQVIE